MEHKAFSLTRVRRMPLLHILFLVCMVTSQLSECLSAADVTSKKVSIKDKIRGAYFGAVVADALTLGTHYEYDAKRIKKFYGAIDRYYAPGEKTGGTTHGVGWGARNYHGGNGRGPPKRAGENTDYGDYNLLVLEHLSAENSGKTASETFSLKTFIPRWKESLKTWRAWMCTQTKLTLRQVQQGIPYEQLGGNSNAMAIRSASAYAFFNKEEDIVQTAKVSMFTHRETTALDGGVFFARVAYQLIYTDMTPREAIVKVSAQSSTFIQMKVQQALDKVDEATDPSNELYSEEYVDDLALTSMARLWEVGKSEPIKVGKASPTEGTLPGSIYFIVKYSESSNAKKSSFAAAAQSNAEVGGDNASRAIAIGMVLGAWEGISAIPREWGPGHYKNWSQSEALLNSAPLLRESDTKQDL